jgi:hypothetical protein
MATAPAFASTVRSQAVAISAADTSRTAPALASTGVLFIAGASGSRVDEITITAAGTTTANVVRIFLFGLPTTAVATAVNTSATTMYLYQEVLISAITPSASVSAFTTTLTFNSLVLPSGASIRVTTNNAEAYHVTAFGGDF